MASMSSIFAFNGFFKLPSGDRSLRKHPARVYGFFKLPSGDRSLRKHPAKVWAAMKTDLPPPSPPLPPGPSRLELKAAPTKGETFTECVEEPLRTKLKYIDAAVSFGSNVLTLAGAIYGVVHVVLKACKKEAWIENADATALFLVISGLSWVVFKNLPLLLAVIKLFF